MARILPHFLPRFEASGGREGWVSFQGAPELDTDVEHILEAARMARGLGVNCIPKIPATGPGLEAFERLVREGCPTLMTEVFSLAQVTETCERYLPRRRRERAAPGVHHGAHHRHLRRSPAQAG